MHGGDDEGTNGRMVPTDYICLVMNNAAAAINDKWMGDWGTPIVWVRDDNNEDDTLAVTIMIYWKVMRNYFSLKCILIKIHHITIGFGSNCVF